MVVDESPISQRRPRKALQPKNSCFKSKQIAKADRGWVDEGNKENAHAHPLLSKPKPKPKAECSQIDASLADELSAIRERLERLRIDKERTDKMLRARAVVLDSQLEGVVDRWMFQKQLEIEVDRLFRLREIELSCISTCTSIWRLGSSRVKEQEKENTLAIQNEASVAIN